MALNEKPKYLKQLSKILLKNRSLLGKPRSKNEHFKIAKESGFIQLKFLQGTNDLLNFRS